MSLLKPQLPKIGMLYLDHVLRFFDRSNFQGWPDKIEQVIYHWGNDKQRFINEVKQKKIDVLIGNIPATAYETFRDIARALPDVTFIPSLDSQFSNKSKENVTHFCEKYQLPIPKTHIFYQPDEALAYLRDAEYPKIVKRSYGPSNYGGYFVHKVDTVDEAVRLFSERRYFPAYIQDFVPMKADIRVMLIGHQPVCAFWRRPPEGEWLTNTSQGGSMDYQDVPREVLDLAVRVSKAAKAEYWACDIAVSTNDEYTILECATAFAAFPYIRDWIGQYLMWQLAPAQFTKPYFVDRNWEELGKIDSSLLRTMRHIRFGHASESTDTGEYAPADEQYSLLNTYHENDEEWPSEAWNFQDINRDQFSRPYFGHDYSDVGNQNADLASEVVVSQPVSTALDTGIEDLAELTEFADESTDSTTIKPQQLVDFFLSVKGVGTLLAEGIVETLGVEGTVEVLNEQPEQLMLFRNLKQKKLEAILNQWHECELIN
ncbi:ATP-grasp domain-containing protein [Photobacterium sanguinicancri]|uniref:ATP-grasp domain-containing protein n=1 Tax=Photobacterium sanguinicancri TaxID=875932 RepID=UPI0026E4628C|nr:hypothetical protein [Photobacterium sanguinicancri]MDO6496767.1 hypothetical protein [Photobacterium sanguinicancri]